MIKSLAVAFTLSLAIATAHSDPVAVAVGTVEDPGVLLAAGSTSLSGTVIATNEVAFTTVVPSSLTGILRSMVVDTGSGLDFYYQVFNTTAISANQGYDIYRLVIAGFYPTGDVPADPVSATFRLDGMIGLDFSAVGGEPSGWIATERSDKGLNENVHSADRDPGYAALGGVGFDFDSSHFLNFNSFGSPTSAPQNIDAGERSNWLVIRTAATAFSMSEVEIDGGIASGGASISTAFAPVPEPATATLIGAFGLLPALRLMRRKSA